MQFLEELKKKFSDAVNDDPYISAIRSQIASLDPKAQAALMWSVIGFVAAVFLAIFLWLMVSASSRKAELAEINEMITYLGETQQKVADLKVQLAKQNKGPLIQVNPDAPFSSNLNSISQRSNIPKRNIESKAQGIDRNQVILKKISLRQLVQMIYFIENSGFGYEVASLKIDSKNDKEGYLWADMMLAKSMTSPPTSSSQGIKKVISKPKKESNDKFIR